MNDSHVKTRRRSTTKKKISIQIHLIDYCDPTVLIMYDKQTTICLVAT